MKIHTLHMPFLVEHSKIRCDHANAYREVYRLMLAAYRPQRHPPIHHNAKIGNERFLNIFLYILTNSSISIEASHLNVSLSFPVIVSRKIIQDDQRSVKTSFVNLQMLLEFKKK